MIGRYIYDVCGPKELGSPERFEPDYWEVVYMCQPLLERFTESQLIEATYRFDLHLHQRQPKYEHHPDHWMTEDTEADYAGGSRAGFVRFSMRSGNRLDEVFGLPDLTWGECFAILAASTVAYACRDEARLDKKGTDEEEVLWRMGRYAVEATKLAMTALVVNADNNITVDLDLYRSRLAKEGAKHKASRLAPFKAKVIELYEAEHRARSNRDAARRIWEALTEEEKLDESGRPYLTTDEPAQRLAVWIGQYKRSTD